MPIRSWAVGLFVVIGLSLFTVILFFVGDRQKAFKKHILLQTRFINISGLIPGAKVRVSGMDAGKIKEIAIPKTASGKFTLSLEVDENLRGMVHTDSVVSIETEGVVGDKFVLIKRGTDRAQLAQAGALLPSKEPFDLSAVMDRASGLLNDIHATVGDVRGRANTALDAITKTVNHADGVITDVRPPMQKILRDGGRISGNIDNLVADLNAGKGPAGLLLRDEATKQQVQATLANVNQTARSASEASAHANQLINDFQSRALAEKTQTTLDNIQAISLQLNTTIKDALAQDSMGEDGAANLRQTLSNLNRSTANLADDTEALKRNFFFRGFFKKRGFYSLDQITTEEYKSALTHNKGAGQRLWLQAATLFAANADGKEELSTNGRQSIDTEVSPVLSKIAGHVIVIEGYAANGNPSEQFTAARRRADQVRRYLEIHYHLQHSNLGIVCLGDRPPDGAGRTNWDGAAIMLLEEKSKR